MNNTPSIGQTVQPSLGFADIRADNQTCRQTGIQGGKGTDLKRYTLDHLSQGKQRLWLCKSGFNRDTKLFALISDSVVSRIQIAREKA